MTTAHRKASDPASVETPWYDLIEDPVPPEDAMQQDDTIYEVMSILRARYENDPTVLCTDETNLVYDSDTPGSVVAPDGYIVFGVDVGTIKRDRRSYRIAEWGPPPAFVLEVASESTASRDLNEKRDIYARMQAQEYWRLDRRGAYYGEPLVGETLVEGQYQRIPLHTDPNGDVWSRSDILGVDFIYRVEEGLGRFLLRDSSTGEILNTLGAERIARQAAENRAREAEQQVSELQAELERLRRHQR